MEALCAEGFCAEGFCAEGLCAEGLCGEDIVKGLESRLQRVDGVAAIELELGVDGLEGITVRLDEGADESAVLESVRRLLVAYGTKPQRGPSTSFSEPSAPPGSRTSDVVDLVEIEDLGIGDRAGAGGSSARREIAGGTVDLTVGPAADGAALVVLERDGRVARRQVPGSAKAIVQAVIDAAAELWEREPVSVMGINLSSVDNSRILTVIAGDYGSSPRVSTTSVVGDDWPSAILDILAQVLESQSSIGVSRG